MHYQLVGLAYFALSITAAPVFGVCRAGVDSTCNGDAWSAKGKGFRQWSDHRIGFDKERRDNLVETQPAGTEEKRGVGDVGVCAIGFDSPCNGDAWNGGGKDGKTWKKFQKFRKGSTTRPAEEKREAVIDDREKYFFKPSRKVLKPGPAKLEKEMGLTGKQATLDKAKRANYGICMTGVDSACNGDSVARDRFSGGKRTHRFSTGESGGKRTHRFSIGERDDGTVAQPAVEE